MSATLLDRLEEEAPGRIRPQPKWPTATRPGSFAPVAVMIHWTAIYSSASRPVPGLGIVTNGHASLPGPLYHLLVGYTGLIHLVHRRLGNHAGAGNLAALRLAQSGGMWPGRRPGRDDATLNRLTWGVSADYHPGQGPMPAAQFDGMVRAVTAIHMFQGWTTARIFDHFNATLRKRDMDTIAGDLQPAIRDHMKNRTQPGLPDPEDIMKRGEKGNHIVVLQWRINEYLNGHPTHPQGVPITGVFDERTEGAVKHIQNVFGYAQTGVYDLALSERITRLLADRAYQRR